MRKVFAATLLTLCAACAPDKARDFAFGVLGPVGPGVEAAALAAGVTVRASAAEGADVRSAAVVFTDDSGRPEERMADWARLRLLTASAAARGRTGIFFVLPKTPQGREMSGYPEEWQALERVAAETAAMRPILERGAEAVLPFAAPVGVEARAWRFRGRLYVLLVNPSELPVPMPSAPLEPWRALFEVRSDPRELLSFCPAGHCLDAGRVLWLEGRL